MSLTPLSSHIYLIGIIVCRSFRRPYFVLSAYPSYRLLDCIKSNDCITNIKKAINIIILFILMSDFNIKISENTENMAVFSLILESKNIKRIT